MLISESPSIYVRLLNLTLNRSPRILSPSWDQEGEINWLTQKYMYIFGLSSFCTFLLFSNSFPSVFPLLFRSNWGFNWFSPRSPSWDQEGEIYWVTQKYSYIFGLAFFCSTVYVQEVLSIFYIVSTP